MDGTIRHPDREQPIAVEIIDEETYHGERVVQVEALADGIELHDQSGEQPWLEADDERFAEAGV